MGRKEAQQDVESFTKDINGGQQHRTRYQGQSSNGAPAAGKNDKQGVISLNHRIKFSGRKRHGIGAAGRKRVGSTRSEGIGKTQQKSSVQKREKKKKKKKNEKKLRSEVKKMKACALEMRTELSRAKREVVDGEAAVEELKALNAQKREENQMQLMMNLCGQLVADEIELYIFP